MDARIIGDVSGGADSPESGDEADQVLLDAAAVEAEVMMRDPQTQAEIHDVLLRKVSSAIDHEVEALIREVVVPAVKEAVRAPAFVAMIRRVVEDEVARETVAALRSIPTRVEKRAKKMRRMAR